MDDGVVLGASFVGSLIIGMVITLLLSPFWYSFAATMLPQMANRVAILNECDDDTEKGSATALGSTESLQKRQGLKEDSRKKLASIKPPNELDACGIDYTIIYKKMVKDNIWSLIGVPNRNDQLHALFQKTIESLSSLTSDYLCQKLFLCLCCIRISSRQLSRNSHNTILRDEETQIIAKVYKVAKRLKSTSDAEFKELETNLPKIIEDSRNYDKKTARDARNRFARLNMQRRMAFVNLVASLVEAYRSELCNRVSDDQVELGVALVFALMIEGEKTLFQFVKRQLLAIVDRNAKRFALVQCRNGKVESSKAASISKQALIDAMQYVSNPRTRRPASSGSRQDLLSGLTEQQEKDLAEQYAAELQKQLQNRSGGGNKTTVAKPVEVDERIEELYIDALQKRMQDLEQLLNKSDSVDPTEFARYFSALNDKHDKDLANLWNNSDSAEMEEYIMTIGAESEEVYAEVVTITESFIEKKIGKDRNDLRDAFAYHLEILKQRDEDPEIRAKEETIRFCSARDALIDEKQLSVAGDLTTSLLRRSAQDMMEMNLIISDEARAKTKIELEYSISTVLTHIVLTKFELELRTEFKLKPMQLKVAAAKEAKLAELQAKGSSKKGEQNNDLGSSSVFKNMEEEVKSSLKEEVGRLNLSEKAEAIATRDELIDDAEAITQVFEKWLCQSVGRYLANQARLENEETNADMAHDLLDAVLKRVAQNSNEAGAQAERVLQAYQSDVTGLQERLKQQRDMKIDRIVEMINKIKGQKEYTIGQNASRLAKAMTKLPETYTAKSFAKAAVEEKAERERERIEREVMRVELLRHKAVLDRKTEEDAKQALQDEKKLLLVRLASLSSSSMGDIKRYTEAAAAEMPIDGDRRKLLIDKLIADFKTAVSKPEPSYY